MSEQNKALVRRFATEVFRNHRLEAIDELCAPEYVWRGPGGQEARGPAAFREMVASYLTAFPDLELAYDELIAEGDKVVGRWTARGTHNGPLMGIPPTGKQVTVRGIIISRIVNGKFVEDWEQFEELSMLQQIGAVPASIATAGA